MRWLATLAGGWLQLAFLLLALLLVVPRAQAQVEPVMLRDSLGEIDAQPVARAWVDPTGKTSFEQVVHPASAERFQPAPPASSMYKLGPEGALWLHLRLQRSRDERQEWVLEFPMPVIDHVTVYQRHEGGWRAESAGDVLAVNSWPEGGRYPFFRLDLPPGETRDVYVRIRHVTAANFPLVLASAASHAHRIQLEYLALGSAFGALLLLIAFCFAQAWVYRDRVFAGYAAYAILTSLAVAAYTGAGAHLLWPGFGALQDAPMPMLAAAAGGAGMLFVRNLIGVRRRFPLQDRVLHYGGLAGGVLTVLAVFLPKMALLPVLGGYMAFATFAMLVVAGLAWRRGDPVGMWVCAAYVPMTLSVVASFLRIFGWAPVSVGSQYAVVVAMAFEIPLLLVALTLRSRDRHSAQVREQALTTHDALTGLLAPHLFHDRLEQVVARYKREGASAAVMFIQLVNHGPIKDHFGAAVAEQSLLRSVIKLRRLLRDVDTASRVGEARFAVILEGASARSSVTERAARLIANGLMPLPGLKPEVPLQFHVAAVLLNERILDADELQAALEEQLARMSPRTRRPIRFLVPEMPSVSQPSPDSSILSPEEFERSRPPLQAVR